MLEQRAKRRRWFLQLLEWQLVLRLDLFSPTGRDHSEMWDLRLKRVRLPLKCICIREVLVWILTSTGCPEGVYSAPLRVLDQDLFPTKIFVWIGCTLGLFEASMPRHYFSCPSRAQGALVSLQQVLKVRSYSGVFVEATFSVFFPYIDCHLTDWLHGAEPFLRS
jgi:hypothetical protein